MLIRKAQPVEKMVAFFSTLAALFSTLDELEPVLREMRKIWIEDVEM